MCDLMAVVFSEGSVSAVVSVVFVPAAAVVVAVQAVAFADLVVLAEAVLAEAVQQLGLGLACLSEH